MAGQQDRHCWLDSAFVIEIGYFEPFVNHGDHNGHRITRINEAPVSMPAMLLLVAAGLVLLGIFSGNIMPYIIMPEDRAPNLFDCFPKDL